MFLEIVKRTFNPGSFVQQEKLPLLEQFLVLLWVRWRKDVGPVLTPHLATHDTGVVGTVTDGNARGVIDQVRYLLTVMLVGRREVDSSQLAFWIDGRMQFKAVVPTLPVLPELSSAFGYPMPVSPHQLADMKHGAVHEPQRCIFHQELVEDDTHTRQCLVALPDKGRIAR